MNQSNLPSKKFIRTVGSGILLIGVAYLASYTFSYVSQLKKPADQFADNAFLNAYDEAERDTDGDALKDWEEILWKSDLAVVDTDSDGTKDGDEVKEGRNPIVAGTKSGSAYSDELKKPSEITKDARDAAKTVTEKIAQEFAKQYFGGKGIAEDELLGSESQQAIADTLVLNVEQGAAAYRNVFDIKTIVISEKKLAKDYINDIGTSLKENFNGIEVSELAVIESILKSQDFSQAALLDHFISAYEKTVKSLKKTPVPSRYADAHLQLLNSMQNTLFAVRDMRQIEKDPARALIGLRVYLKESDRSREYLLLFKNQVTKDNLAFKGNEPGSFFVQYLQ